MEEMPGQNNEQMVGGGEVPNEVNNETVTESVEPVQESIVSATEEIVSKDEKEDEKIVSTDEKIVTGDEKKKGGKGGAIFGVILALLLTAGGVAFGIYGMMQGTQKDGEISDLKVQVANKDSIIETLKTEKAKVPENPEEETIKPGEGVVRTNPIIYNMNSEVKRTGKEYKYLYHYESGYYSIGEDTYYLELTVEDGKIATCKLMSVNPNASRWYDKHVKDCAINGISGKIYDIAEILRPGEGARMVFIAEDGTVEYTANMEDVIKEILESGVSAAKGKMKIDGFVVSAREIVPMPSTGGSGAGITFFILADGSYVEYDSSMLN